MKLNVWTYNINSIRKKVSLIESLLKKHDIDILVVTETKIMKEHEESIKFNNEYKVYWNSNQSSYHHGTAVIYKKNLKIKIIATQVPTQVINNDCRNIQINNSKNTTIISAVTNGKLLYDVNVAHKTEGRIIVFSCTFHIDQELIVVGTYVPNSGSNKGIPFRRLAYRTKYWDIDLFKYLKKLEQKYKYVIWLGDLNVASKDNDMIKNHLKYGNFAGITIEERYNFNNFLHKNLWTDTWDILNKNKTDIESRCTYGVNSYCKLRLDYVICSSALVPFLELSKVDQVFVGSDHVPMGTRFCFLDF